VVAVHTATFKQARQFVPVLVPVAAATGVGGGTRTFVVLAVAITLFSLLTAFVSWWRFGYDDGPTAVVVARGLLARSVRTVPNDRIRGVEVEAPLLHRLFGLVRVRIDAAAGSAGNEEELVVDGVTRAEGARLRDSVLPAGGVRAGADGDPAPEPSPEEFARFDNRWLLYAPLVGSYLAVPAAAVGALSRLTQELPRSLRPEIDDPGLSGVQVLGAAAVLAVVVLVGGSVIGAAVVNWGFRLTRRGGSLVAVRGLVTRRHTELEIDRIRGCTVAEGAGMRLVGAARASALVTGLGDAQRRGQLLPLGPRAEAWSLVGRLVEGPGPLVAHPPAARRRRIVRAMATGAVGTAAGAVAAALLGWWWALVPGLVLLALGWPLGLARYAALGHAAGPSTMAVRSGWLVRETAVLQRRAVVGWRVHQSPFQRRQGVATVTACVGAGSGGYTALDMAAAEVAGFTAAASGTWARTFTP
jgi:putative membrane protein